MYIKNSLATVALLCLIQSTVAAQQVNTIANLNQGTMGDGITVAITGDIYYSSGFGTSFNKIYKITPEGEFSVYKDNISNPVGIISDSLLNLYVPTYLGNSVRKVDTLGTVSTIATGLNGPAGIVFNDKGELFVSEYGAGYSGNGNRIVQINPDSTVETYVSDSSFRGLVGLTADEQGNLYTSNWGDGSVFKVTPEKEVILLVKLGVNINQISYSNGFVLAPSPSADKIYKVNVQTGEYEIIAGTGKSGNKNGSVVFAEFSRPNGIAPSATGDTLYFNDGGIVKAITGANLTKIEQTADFKNKEISINVKAPSNYDSLHVIFNGEPITTFYSTLSTDSMYHVPLEPEITEKAEIYVFGYSGTQITVSNKSEAIILSLQSPIDGYKTDFDERPTADFLLDGFSIQSPFSNLLDYRAHTEHDYKENSSYEMLLVKPIKLSADSAKLVYRDVAIVEPGEEGSAFGTSEFKDYVIVEAYNGSEWFALAEGYDARYDSSWFNTWPENGDSDELFRTHTFDLLDTFGVGDTVLIRFRLHSDETGVGYGWVISELEIQGNLVTSADHESENLNSFELGQNYPNPFNPTTNIEFSIPNAGYVRLSVFDITGRKVATLVDEQRAPGNYVEIFDAEALSSGIYLYRLEAGNQFIQTNKMLLIK